jgi:hypothetical protein
MMYEVKNSKELEKVWAQVKAGDCIVIIVEDKQDYHYSFTHIADSSREDWSGVCC